MTERAASLDVVVIGSHSGSLSDRLFAGKVFRRSRVPVTSVRWSVHERGFEQFQRVADVVAGAPCLLAVE